MIARRPLGFTLVELMVVVFIIGMAGVVVVLTAPGHDDGPGHEADVLAARLVRAREEAILGTRAVEVTVTAQGYGFTRQHFGRWEPLRDGPFDNVLWQDGTRPALPPGREQLTFHFDPIGAASIERLALLRDGRRAWITVDAGGEVRVDASSR
jgi:general secretion pathway protein H